MAFLWNPWNVLTRMYRRRKKNDTFCTSARDRDDQIATCAKLLNIKYKFYRFTDDLKETIN